MQPNIENIDASMESRNPMDIPLKETTCSEFKLLHNKQILTGHNEAKLLCYKA